MKNNRLLLNQIRVKSFTTDLKKEAQKTVRGGNFIPSVCKACDVPNTLRNTVECF